MMDISVEPSKFMRNHIWLQRLLWNLLSYCIILLPILIFVTLIKRNVFCFSGLQNTYLVRLFVYGKEGYEENEVHLKSVVTVSKGPILPQSFIPKKKSKWSTKPILRFLYCFAGLQASFITYGVLQEKIMTTGYFVDTLEKPLLNSSRGSLPSVVRFHETEFLVFLNRLATFLLAIVALLGKGLLESLQPTGEHKKGNNVAPLYMFVFCSLSNVLSSWCQNEALKYVNYPSQVLSKSCKIIPVMLMSKLMDKKSYPWTDYIIAAALSTGVAVFLFGTQRDQIPTTSSSSSLSLSSQVTTGEDDQSKILDGLLILILFLTFDSFSSNWQGKIFKTYKISSLQLMLVASFYSVLLTLCSLTEQDYLRPTFNFMLSSSELTRDCLLFALSSSVGQLFTYYTISSFGPVVFVTIMTVRQAVSIFISCLLYSHRLTIISLLGLFIVFPVLFIQICIKYRQRRK